jgi:hypothetical protein
MGDFGDAVGVGIGATLGFEVPIGDNLGFMVQAGYISFMGKTYDSFDPITFQAISAKSDATGAIPIQVGLKYYFTDNQEGFYAGLLTGVHLFMVKVPDFDPVTYAMTEKTETNTDFGLAPELGYIIGDNIDISLRYQLIFAKSEAAVLDPTTFSVTTVSKTVTNSYLGVRVAYMFGGGGGHHRR